MMFNLSKGEIELKEITLGCEDTLTDVLMKTVSISKQIQNRENKQVLFFSNVLVCSFFNHCAIIFSDLGKMEKVILCFEMDDIRNQEKDVFLNFLSENNISSGSNIENGLINLNYEPHFSEYSICLEFN